MLLARRGKVCTYGKGNGGNDGDMGCVNVDVRTLQVSGCDAPRDKYTQH